MTTRRRGQNEGSIYRRGKDGRWVGAVTLGYHGGKRRRKSVYGRTRREVQEKITKLLTAQQDGLPIPTGRQSVEQFLTRWLTDVVRTSVRPRTHESYSSLVECHIAPVLGKVQLEKLTPQNVQAFMNGKLEEGLSPRTVQYLRAVLRRALGQALKWGLVPRNVATLVDPPHVRKFELNPLTPDELRELLDAVKGNRFEALFILTVTTGLRRGEVLGLQKEDVDLKHGQLRVRHALQRVKGYGLQLVETKSAAARRPLKLSKLAVEALTRHRRRQLKQRLAAGSRWTESGFIFTSRKGTPVEPATVIRNYHRVLKNAGLRHQRFHDLRHANASLLLAEGVHPRVVMEMLGHSQISLTLDTYSRTSFPGCKMTRWPVWMPP